MMISAISPNITPAGPAGDWTDEELARAIREGIRPDGTLIGPPMPFALYRGLSDTDLAAIVAFLRTVKPVENDPPKSVYHIPLPPAWGPPVKHVADTPRGPPRPSTAPDIAGPIAHCLECHTPMAPDGHMLFDTALGAGRLRVSRTLGPRFGGGEHHLERGRACRLQRRGASPA